MVNLNGKDLRTRFVSSILLLEAHSDLKDLTTPARYPLTVKNPSPVRFASNLIFLSVVENESLLPTTKKVETLKGEGAVKTETVKKGTIKDEPIKATATLTGRILNTQKEPIEGITIQIKAVTAETDANGYFFLHNVPSGKQQVMIYGPTAKEAASHYPTIPLTVNIQPDTVNEMPFQIYLHRQKNYNFKEINPAKETLLTDPDFPGFELKIPKGVKITGWDKQPNSRISVRAVPPDRPPVKPLPPNAFARTAICYFNKIGGGTPDQPIPIKAPNDLGLLPGEKAVLWYYDESPNEGEAPNDWAIAGTGTVTPDGLYIVSDPGVGIPKFCCGATSYGGTPLRSPPSGPPDPDPDPDPCKNNNDNTAGDPVNLATGYFMHERSITGSRASFRSR